MTGIFIKLLNMSIVASWLILAVIILRLLLKKAPKRLICVLWILVAVRLISPMSFESSFSLIPCVETVQYQVSESGRASVNTGINRLDQMLNHIISGENVSSSGYMNTSGQDADNSNSYMLHGDTTDSNSDMLHGDTTDKNSDMLLSDSTGMNSDDAINEAANGMSIMGKVLTWIWCAGMIATLLYAVVSYSFLRRRVAASIRYKDNIWINDTIETPFILGVIRPQIYLPAGIGKRDEEYVIAHEKTHLSRKDHWWKPLGFVLFAVYWFHPLVWIGYMLFCRDIEMACDEKVIRDMSLEDKKNYSAALLSLSVKRHRIAACPVAFGEVGVKARIKQVLNYKKPAFWASLAAIVVCAAAAVCFLTNPVQNEEGVKLSDEQNKAGKEAKEKNSFENDVKNTDVTAEQKSFEEAKDYLTSFTDNSAENLAKDGCFVIQQGKINYGLQPWNEFISNVNNESQAELVIVQYTTEGDPILDYLYYSGKDFYHMQDSSRDNFGNPAKQYAEHAYNYLKVFEPVGSNGDKLKYIALTDNKDLTYEMLSQSEQQNSSDGNSKAEVYELAVFVDGNEAAEVKEDMSWHDLGYDYDMTTVLVPKDQVTSIVVRNSKTGARKTYAVTDGSNLFNEIMNLYYALNASPADDDMEMRAGYSLSMDLFDWEGNLLQQVIPYTDGVMLDYTMYESSANGSSAELLIKLSQLDW